MGSGAPRGGAGVETLHVHGGRPPVGPQGEGDGRQLFTICAGGDQTVCRALGSQAGLGVHAGGSPWGQVTCPGLLASAKPVRLMNLRKTSFKA